MRFPRFHHKRRERDVSQGQQVPAPRPPQWEDLGDETEAFLDGYLVEHLVARGRPVPSWVAVNRLAHATFAELEGLIEGQPREAVVDRPWAATERALAVRLTGVGPRDAGLIQRSVLVPLELVLIEEYKVHPITMLEVLEAISQALDNHLLDH